MKRHMRHLAAGVAIAVALTGAAQAEPFNIFAASQAGDARLETVKHRHHGHRHRHHRDKAALAIGALGVLAGVAAAAADRDRYYDDGYYYDEPRSYYYEEDDDYCDDSRRPKHYPAPPGC